MTTAQIAAWIFLALQSVLALFQVALAAGAPWGALAMGGRFPGRFPPAMRLAALAQLLIYSVIGVIIASRAGIDMPELYDVLPGWSEFSRMSVWPVVALMAVAVVLNVITPSKWERRIWAPVALGLFASSLVVALS